MALTPRIELLHEKKLMGKRLRMNLANNRTPELWRGFMPRRKEIKNAVSTYLISMQVHDPHLDFKDFTMETEHDKWATIEVHNFEEVPEGMETFILPAGLYAVFLYKGAASAFRDTFTYIFHTWLPQSEYELDKRPHFELIGEKYKNEDPESEEEIWVPIRRKSR